MLENESFSLSKYFNYIELERPEKPLFGIYHSVLGELCFVDNHIFNVLQSIDENSNYQEITNSNKTINKLELDDIIQEFYKKGFIVRYDEKDKDNKRLKLQEEERLSLLHTGKQIKSIQLVVSNKCNYKCKYCFTKSIYSSKEREIYQEKHENQIMKPEDAIAYLDKILEMCKKNGNEELHIQFFGGEPLTNWPTIKSVLDCYKNCKDNVNITYSIVTNGALITQEVASYFKKYDIPFIISFDSPNDSHRYTQNGKLNIEKVTSNLQILKLMDNYVAFNSVLSKETFDYFNEAIIDFAIENNVKEIGVLLDLEPSFYEMYDKNTISDKLMKVYEYGREKGVVVTGYWHSVFQNMVNNTVKGKGFKTCSGTGSQLSIEPAGVVFSCKGSSAYYGTVHNLLELFNSDRYKSYASRSFINSEECLDCNLLGFCSGYCLGALEKKYSSINVVEKNVCELNRELVRRLINLEYDRLDVYEIDQEGVI